MDIETNEINICDYEKMYKYFILMSFSSSQIESLSDCVSHK